MPPENPGWDAHLSFTSPEILEFMNNTEALKGPSGEYVPRQEYAHLKDVHIDLGGLGLTDRQMIAVSLVFYGGLSKTRAARAMNITAQALSDHIKAGLKKISRSIC